MVKPTVWVPRPVHPDALARLEKWADVRRGWGNDSCTFDDVAATVEGILLRTERVDAQMVERAPRLRAIARHGAGADSVDLEAAAARGIRVATTPGANAPAVAEHTLALILAVRRGIGHAARHGANAERETLVGNELRGSTLGVIGFGRISREVTRIAAAGFGANVVAYDPYADDDLFRLAGVERLALADVASRSHTVSVHVPLTVSTRGIIDDAFLAQMPPGGVVINTSRGGVIDEDALQKSLASGHTRGAGLDVTTTEPLPAAHPLRDHPGVIITPHIGGQTTESMRRVALEAEHALRLTLCPPHIREALEQELA